MPDVIGSDGSQQCHSAARWAPFSATDRLINNTSLNLPEKVADELAVASREANQSLEAFAEKLLRWALTVRKLRDARSKLVRYGEAAGFKNDDDVFDTVS